MTPRKYITLQLIPDGTGRIRSLRLRYGLFKFLGYCVVVVILALSVLGGWVTRLSMDRFSTEQLIRENRELRERRDKLVLLEKEIAHMEEQEKILRRIFQTFVEGVNHDSLVLAETLDPNDPEPLRDYVSKVRNIGKSSRGDNESQITDAPDIWPVEGIISRGFGRTSVSGRPHHGIDIIASPHTLVVGTAAGIVSEAGWEKDLGKRVVVDHGNGLQTVYGHLERILVQLGDHIEKGGSVGTVGNSGNSFGPHLHYEILYLGNPVDPQLYLK